MRYGYFPIRLHVPNVSKCNRNECLSVRIFGSVCELAIQTEIYLRTPSSVNVLFKACSVGKIANTKTRHCIVHRIAATIPIIFSEL